MALCVSLEPRVALALLCAVALAHAHGKRAESEFIVSPAPFTFAARYGRSPERFITPRNDRWMMTTRYGKRSELSLEVPPAQPAPPSYPDAGDTGGEPWLRGGKRLALACRYTGVMELYRCTRTRVNSFERRGDDDPAPNDEE